MKQTNHFLPDQQREALKRMAEKTGLSVSELIRRAVDLYLETRNGNHPIPRPQRSADAAGPRP